MTAHKHAHLMLQYAQDALETDKPWTRWQVLRLDAGGQWVDCFISIGWDVEAEYRRKPKTLTYTVTIPEPMREAPTLGSVYWICDPTSHPPVTWGYWSAHDSGQMRLARGLCFSTEADAITAAKAMLPIKGEEA